jgi:hypothetical protein
VNKFTILLKCFERIMTYSFFMLNVFCQKAFSKDRGFKMRQIKFTFYGIILTVAYSANEQDGGIIIVRDWRLV